MRAEICVSMEQALVPALNQLTGSLRPFLQIRSGQPLSDAHFQSFIYQTLCGLKVSTLARLTDLVHSFPLSCKTDSARERTVHPLCARAAP